MRGIGISFLFLLLVIEIYLGGLTVLFCCYLRAYSLNPEAEKGVICRGVWGRKGARAGGNSLVGTSAPSLALAGTPNMYDIITPVQG